MAFPGTITAGAEAAIPDLPAPLPVNTSVASNTYVLGHSTEIWGDDARTWKPEQWLVADGSKQELEEKVLWLSARGLGVASAEILLC